MQSDVRDKVNSFLSDAGGHPAQQLCLPISNRLHFDGNLSQKQLFFLKHSIAVLPGTRFSLQ